MAAPDYNGIEFVRVESVDMHGVLRAMTVDVDYYRKNSKNGVPLYTGTYSMTFDSSAVDNPINQRKGNQNHFMYPDPTTYIRLPWKPNVASVYVDNHMESCNQNSAPVSFCPRMLVKQQLKKLGEMGLAFCGALEYEFYVLEKESFLPGVSFVPIRKTFNFASTQGGLPCEPIIYDVMRMMKKMNLAPEAYHSEYGPGQNEITMSPGFGIACPDNAVRFKQLVKEIALKHGYEATFMSKPYLSECGSSGHYNHSVWNKEETKNLFYDADKKNNMSDLFRHWIAGLRHHTPALRALFSSTTNCYERFGLGHFAPIDNSWGYDNREAAYRAKAYSTTQTYVENRLPGAGCNPYLVTAGVLVAGMDGINRKLDIGEESFQGEKKPADTVNIADNLQDALKDLNNSEVFKREFGEDFFTIFNALKNKELEMFSKVAKPDREKWYQKFYGEWI